MAHLCGPNANSPRSKEAGWLGMVDVKIDYWIEREPIAAALIPSSTNSGICPVSTGRRWGRR
jgi:hypothetical protein